MKRSNSAHVASIELFIIFWYQSVRAVRRLRNYRSFSHNHLQACSSKALFGRASGAASRAAAGEALPNVCFVTGFTREVGSEAIGGLHRQDESHEIVASRGLHINLTSEAVLPNIF